MRVCVAGTLAVRLAAVAGRLTAAAVRTAAAFARERRQRHRGAAREGPDEAGEEGDPGPAARGSGRGWNSSWVGHGMRP